ncbi:MAG: hypothetical protein ACO1PB_17985 [Ramlibacter sp.]
MTNGSIPDDVRRFISVSIASVPFLEALLLMRAAPETAWSARLLSQRLYAPEATCRELLQALRKAGIAQLKGTDELYAYGPAAELGVTLDALADCYGRNLVEVSELIHSRIDKRARQLSDAFSWRSEK